MIYQASANWRQTCNAVHNNQNGHCRGPLYERKMSSAKLKSKARHPQLKSPKYNFSNCIAVFGLSVLLAATAYGYFTLPARTDAESSPVTVNSILPPDGEILKEILIPRVPGTFGHARVRNFIKSQFSGDARWVYEEDSFTEENTPIGHVLFTNIIITSNLRPSQPNRKRIVLAAHYDSKFLEMEKAHGTVAAESSTFVGATDSGWSCAFLIFLAKSLRQETLLASSFDIQLIFFDGEEALKSWTSTDSLYGSRHLAEKWASDTGGNSLANIELFVLLDLLGGKEMGQGTSRLYSQQAKSRHLFEGLMEIEQRRFPDSPKIFELKYPTGPDSSIFLENAVDDDHVPFMKHNVPIMHLIPVPFPTIWHTEKDDISALDREACKKLSTILLEFVESLL